MTAITDVVLCCDVHKELLGERECLAMDMFPLSFSVVHSRVGYDMAKDWADVGFSG